MKYNTNTLLPWCRTLLLVLCMHLHYNHNQKSCNVYFGYCNERLFLWFFKRTCFIFFSKIIFQKFLFSLYSYYVRYSTGSGTLFDWVQYTIRLESSILFNWSPVHFNLPGCFSISTGVNRCYSK